MNGEIIGKVLKILGIGIGLLFCMLIAVIAVVLLFNLFENKAIPSGILLIAFLTYVIRWEHCEY